MKKKLISIFLSALILIVSFNVIGSSSNNNDKLILIRLNKGFYNFLVFNNFEIVGSESDQYFDVIIPKDRLNNLYDAEIDFEIIISDVEEYDNSVRGSYHTFAQMEDILNNIANDYPDITDLYSIGTTFEGRNIWCLEISNNPGVDEGEPGVFFMGLHHAREWPTVEICLHIADELTSNYGSNTQITNLVNNRRIWLVTCVNPDGYYYCHDLGNDWRKNRKPYPGGIGVDPNRNYAGSSDGDPWGAWGSVGTGSISNNPSSEVYCGPSPFSEAETQAVRNIFIQNDISAAITWHTHGQLVLWPWGYTPNTAPDSSYISQVGQQIAAQITRQSGSGTYTPQQACSLYPTTGDTIDWAYGFSHYVIGRPTFAYTIEACDSFHPSASYLDQICMENFDGALVLLEEADDIKNTVTPRVVPPIINQMGTDSDGDYTVSWEVQNPDSNPDKFQLDELIGPTIYTDDVESSEIYWNFNGFSKSTTRYHSSSHSYKSGSGNSQVYSMVTINPIFVSTDINLEFWCWYNLEDDYDMTFVEVSTNGRNFAVLDSFTGSSSNWEQKQYSLNDYVGKSIFIRFRYITDQNTLEEGFYVDDISPVVSWDSITTLSDNIIDNYYDITGKDNGTYFYRVKGYNSLYEWGDFSYLEDITVQLSGNNPPETPIINGTASGKPGIEYNYSFVTTDPDGNNLYYYVDWGDENNTGWLGPYLSGEEISESHMWLEKGTYIIKAKAKDIYDAESDWSNFEVTIPRTRLFYNSLLKQFFNRFQGISLILNFIKNYYRLY